MGSSILVPINPELLIWARESAGYDTMSAASRLGVTKEKLEIIEAGEVQVTYAQLKKASEVYKRSMAAFFMASPPQSKEPPHDFRMQHEHANRPLSPVLTFEIRKAWKHRDDVIELAQQMGKSLPVFEPTATMRHSPERVANVIRKLLNIDVREQLAWKNSTIALKHWKAAVEAFGVLVFEASRIPMEEMRGVSLWSDVLPVILLNGADSHTGRAFTLLHEFTHLLLRQGGVCDLAPAELESQDAKVEAFCNAVAGAALVPHEVLQQLLVGDHDAEWSMAELDEFSRHFKVSKEVVLRRLLILGKTTDGYYQNMRQVFVEEYRRIREENRGDGGPSPAVMAVRNLGRPFVGLVLGAYHDNMIGLATVSDYLGLKIKHLPRVESLMMRGET